MSDPSQASNKTPGDHYFDEQPTVASDPKTIELTLPDVHLRLTTDRGVFGIDAVDTGTKYLLLEAPHPPDNTTLADLGCGYGPIALTLASRAPKANVWAIDTNERARNLTKANAEAAGLPQVRVCAPAEVPSDLRFDRIYSNPPIRIGKAALHELLTLWLDRLTPDGIAYLVVQKHLGSDSLMKWLNQRGWPTTKRSSRKAFRILEVHARPPHSSPEDVS